MSRTPPGFSLPGSPEFGTEHIPITAEGLKEVSFTLAQIPNHLKGEHEPGGPDAPFRREQLLAVLELAAAKHRGSGLSFVLFPEMSIPLLFLDDMTELLNRTDFPSNFVVSFGLEYVSLAEFSELFHNSQNSSEYEKLWVAYVQSRLAPTKKSVMVNCAVVLCKTADGVQHFVQVKLGGDQGHRPSKDELLGGKFVHLFEGRNLAFVSLICEDLIYRDSSSSLVASLRREASRMRLEEGKTLDFVFVLQCNPCPDNLTLRGAIDAYYDFRLSGGPFRHTCFVLANASHVLAAGKRLEGDFGSSAVFLPPKCAGPESECSLVMRDDSDGQDRLSVACTEPCVVHFTCRLLRDFQAADLEVLGPEATRYGPVSDLEIFTLTESGIQASDSALPASLSREAGPPLKSLDVDSLRTKLGIDARLGDTDIVVPKAWESRLKNAVGKVLGKEEKGGIVFVTGQPGSGKTVFLYLVCKELLARGGNVSWLSGPLVERNEDVVLFDDLDRLPSNVFSSLVSRPPSRALFSCRVHELEYLKSLLRERFLSHSEISVELSGVENRQFIRDVAGNMARNMDIDILPGALSALARRKGIVPLFVTTLLEEIRAKGGSKLTVALASRMPTAFAQVILRALDSTLRALNTQRERKVRVLVLAALALYGKPINFLHLRAVELQLAKRIEERAPRVKRFKRGHLPLPLREAPDTGRIWFIHDAWSDVLRSPEMVSQKSATGRLLSGLMQRVELGQFLRSSLREAIAESTRAARESAKEGRELTSLIRDAVERKWFDILPSDFPAALVEYEGGNLSKGTLDLFKECSWKCMEASRPGRKSERDLKLSADALSEAANYYKRRADWSAYAGIRGGLGLVHLRLAEMGVEPAKNLGEARVLLEEAADLHRREESWLDYPEALGSLWRVYFGLAEMGIESQRYLDLSVQVLSEALGLYERQERWGHYARASQDLGRTYATLAEAGFEPETNLKSAIETLSKAKEFHEEQEDWKSYAKTVTFLADGYARLAEMGVEPKKNEALAATATLEIERARDKLSTS